MIVQGLQDETIPLSEPLRLVDALVRAGKSHEFLVIPGGLGESENAHYVREATRRFFEEHLKP